MLAWSKILRMLIGQTKFIGTKIHNCIRYADLKIRVFRNDVSSKIRSSAESLREWPSNAESFLLDNENVMTVSSKGLRLGEGGDFHHPECFRD
jgi:hypothetical protein